MKKALTPEHTDHVTQTGSSHIMQSLHVRPVHLRHTSSATAGVNALLIIGHQLPCTVFRYVAWTHSLSWSWHQSSILQSTVVNDDRFCWKLNDSGSSVPCWVSNFYFLTSCYLWYFAWLNQKFILELISSCSVCCSMCKTGKKWMRANGTYSSM